MDSQPRGTAATAPRIRAGALEPQEACGLPLRSFMNYGRVWQSILRCRPSCPGPRPEAARASQEAIGLKSPRLESEASTLHPTAGSLRTWPQNHSNTLLPCPTTVPCQAHARHRALPYSKQSFRCPVTLPSLLSGLSYSCLVLFYELVCLAKWRKVWVVGFDTGVTLRQRTNTHSFSKGSASP